MFSSYPYIVVVDDDPDEGLLITRIFGKMDPPVDLCLLSNGAEALEKLGNPNAREPALVVMDNKMPFNTGTEVIAELMQMEHMQEVPIVLMSAQFSKKELRQAYKAGARSCVLKGDDYVEWSRNLRGILTYWLKINQVDAHEGY